jgi:SAM-dependent methyltransferase
MRCAVCGGEDLEPLYEAGDRLGLAGERFEVRRCRACGAGATWPPATEADLARFYPDEYWGESAEPDRAWLARTQREKTSTLERHMPEGGRVLDVGCGAGFFLRALDPAVWERWGVEISPRSAEAAARHVGDERIFAGRLVDADFVEGSFDAVTFWASLEHVASPRADLETAHRILRPGGLLVVQVPNLESYQARRFGGDWFALDLPRHRTHFGPSSLERIASDAGFDALEMLYRSETHDAHALKQSLKTKLVKRRAPLGRLRYYAAAPFLKLADRVGGGATLTLVARRRTDAA